MSLYRKEDIILHKNLNSIKLSKERLKAQKMKVNP